MKQTEIYLTRKEFAEQFVIGDDCEITRFKKQGLPVKTIDGKELFPKHLCHRWFAGET